MRLQRLEAGGDADAVLQTLAGRRGVAGAQRVAQAELQPVDAEPVGQLVISASCAIAACGTPKPRKAPAGGPLVWIARASVRDSCGIA